MKRISCLLLPDQSFLHIGGRRPTERKLLFTLFVVCDDVLKIRSFEHHSSCFKPRGAVQSASLKPAHTWRIDGFFGLFVEVF